MVVRKIFFDLDGTILDSRERLFRLFLELVPECRLTFYDYWELKRNMKSHQFILTNLYGYDEKSIEMFEQIWKRKIELKKWLKLDFVFDGLLELLPKLKYKYELNLITSRQSVENTFWQLELLGLTQYFKKVIVANAGKSKLDLLKNHNVSHDSVIIGDTGIEVETGKKLNMITVSVLSGFRNEQILLNYSPDYIIESVLEIQNILNL